MTTMSFMRLTKQLIGILVLVIFFVPQAESKEKTATPESELVAFKEKYPDEPIITALQKKEIEIVPDITGIPVFHIKETRIDIILSDNGSNISEGKEYFNSKDIVTKFEAYSLIPENNKYKKLLVNNIKKSSEFDDNLYYDDSFCFSFNFPATGKGVKRCTYSESTIRDPYYPIIFYFAGYLPIDEAELTITIPQTMKINFQLFGGNVSEVNETQTEKGNQVIYRWVSHQPKVKDRDFMAPSVRYFRPHLIAQLASYNTNGQTTNYMANLDDLSQWLHSKIDGLNDTITPELKLITDSITHGITDQTEKVRAIYKWVQNNIKYIAIEDGENGFIPRKASLVLKRRYGDCKDKTSLLTTMIRAIGEKADFVSVGTRDLPYRYSEFPTIAVANHMVAVWWKNGIPVVLDGTTRHFRLEDIPAQIQGKEGLIECKDGGFKIYEIPIADCALNSQTDTLNLVVNGDLLIGKGKTSATGETRVNLIYRLERKDTKQQQDYWPAAIFSSSDKLSVSDIETTSLPGENYQLHVGFAFQLPDYITRQDKNIYVNMNIERMLSGLDVKTDRVIPIEVESRWKHQVVYRLQIPENMQVSYLPEPTNFSNPKFGFSQTYEQSKHEIILNTHIYANTFLIEGQDITVFRQMLEILKKAYRQTVCLSAK